MMSIGLRFIFFFTKRRTNRATNNYLQEIKFSDQYGNCYVFRSKRLGSFYDSQQKKQSQYTAVHILIRTFC